MAFITHTKPWIKRIEAFFVDMPLKTSHRCCLSFSNHTIKLIHLNHTIDHIEVLQAENLKYDKLENIPLILSGMLKKFKLQDVPIYWLLSPLEYQLFLIDALPVEREELDSALNWRLRNLITYPIDDTVYDFFNIPAGIGSANKPTVAVAVARKTNLQKIISILNDFDLSIASICIPEIAMRKLAAFNERKENSTAFIYFFDNIAILNITRKKTLYFTRQLNLPKETLNEAHFKQISLDLLRFFDYFQTQWRHASPNKVLLACENQQADLMAKQLSDSLMMPVEPFSFNNLSIHPKNEPDFLLEIACVLDKEIQQ